MDSNSLENWRKQIDELDKELLHTLAKRVDIVREIGKFKKAHGVAPLDQKRWQEVLQSKLLEARSLNLSEEFIEKLYNLIHEYSLEIESDDKQL